MQKPNLPTDRRVTVLPDGPVAQHTMRRGIPRLHPVADGTADMQRASASIIRRDAFGGKLVDVIDPYTGFCVGVRSNAYSAPNNDRTVRPGVSGAHNAMTRSAVVAEAGNGVLVDPETGHAIRTVDMGDNPLPSIRGGNMHAGSQTQKGNPNGAPRAVKSPIDPGRPGRRNPLDFVLPDGRVIVVPGGQRGIIRKGEILTAIENMAASQGKPVPAKITRAMEIAARNLLKSKRRAILKTFGVVE